MGTIADHDNSHGIPVVILNTSSTISALGFGTEAPGTPEEVEDAVLSAIKMGFRHFDTAHFYETEEAVGRALQKAFESGLIKREDVFITSKIEDGVDASQVLSSLKKSLSSLQLDYIDMLLLHAPVKLRKSCTFPPKLRRDLLLPCSEQKRWQALEECVGAGLTKVIGVCNFSMKKLKDLLEDAKVFPVVNQVEVHPLWQQKQLVEFCRCVGVRVSSWRPFGGQSPLSVHDNPVIKEIAEKHGKTPNQIALRWITENGYISIVQSYNADKLSEYINIFDFKLSPEDRERIANLDHKGMLV